MIDKNTNSSKSGFTLIELIAVITIVLVVSVSTIISYSKILKREESSDYNMLIDNLKSATKSYLSISNLGCDQYILSLSKLKSNGLISSTTINPKTDNEIDYTKSFVNVTCDSNNKYYYDVILVDKG